MRLAAAAGTPAFWAVAVVLVVVPLALAPGLQSFDITPKLLALLAGACAAWLALAAEGRWSAFRRQPAFFLSLAGLAAVGLLAHFLARDRVISLAGSEWRRMGLPAWLGCLALAAAIPSVIGEDGSRRRRLVSVVVLTTVGSAAYGVAQYLGHDPWIDRALYHVGEGEWQIVRPPSTLGYVSYFAAFVLPAMFAAAGLALSAAVMRARLVWGASAAALALALLISGSRGAWLGATAGLIVLLAGLDRRRALLLGLLAVSTLGTLFVLSPPGQPLRSRLRWFVEDPGGGARRLIWRDSLRMVRAYPLAGVGHDAFGRTFPAFESLQLAQEKPDEYVESPHNIFLDYLTTGGLPALLLFVLLIGTAVRNYAVASRVPGSTDSRIDAALLAGLTAGLVAAQFIVETIPTRLHLLAFAALSVSAPLVEPRRRSRWAVAVLAVAALVPVLVFGTRLVRADRFMFQALQAAGRGDVNGALQAARDAHHAFPWTGTYAFAYSRLLGKAAASANLPPEQRGLLMAMGEEAAGSAVPHSTRPALLQVHMATLQVLQGKVQEAGVTLEAAIVAAPAWYRPRWLLAVLLSSRGKHLEAAAQAKAAMERGARKYPEIAAQCLQIERVPAK
jgi:hypothetical protein